MGVTEHLHAPDFTSGCKVQDVCYCSSAIVLCSRLGRFQIRAQILEPLAAMLREQFLHIFMLAYDCILHHMPAS